MVSAGTFPDIDFGLAARLQVPRSAALDMPNMKLKIIRLSQRYVTALRTHLKPGAQLGLQAARELGRRAVALGVETLELARIHEQAVIILKSSINKNGHRSRADSFFTEANGTIKATHRASQQSKASLSRLEESLDKRTHELAASHRQVQRGNVRRKVLEVAAVKNRKDHGKSLEESLELQTHLRQLTHRMMVAQEDDRTKISHELQVEIAQTLLGINVRLLSLKNEARTNTKGFHDEITSTQQLVLKSAKFVRRFARELKAPQPA
jgi:signal transduction histidine kinase